MTDDPYRDGIRAGLREALEILAAEEAKWNARMGKSPSRFIRRDQAVRHKAYQVAQKRIQTALNARERQDTSKGTQPDAAVRSALARLGL